MSRVHETFRFRYPLSMPLRRARPSQLGDHRVGHGKSSPARGYIDLDPIAVFHQADQPLLRAFLVDHKHVAGDVRKDGADRQWMMRGAVLVG